MIDANDFDNMYAQASVIKRLYNQQINEQAGNAFGQLHRHLNEQDHAELEDGNARVQLKGQSKLYRKQN